MKPHDILFGKDGRFRSGWRASIFVFAFIVVSIFFGSVLRATLTTFGNLSPGSPAFSIASSLLALAASLLLGWGCGRALEELPMRALGASFTENWWKNLLVGILLGAITIAVAIGIASFFGDLDFSFNTAETAAIFQTLIVSLIVFAIAAAFEEALFRGYILQTFARSGLAWFAIILTSVFFGAVHLSNPNAGYLSSINTAIAGIWFGVAYLKTRDLWLVGGLHLMWNWMQGSIFGIEVSGLTEIVPSPLLRESDGGPAWLTGAEYGMEASVACTIALIVSTIGIHYLPGLTPNEEMYRLTSVSPDPTRTSN